MTGKIGNLAAGMLLLVLLPTCTKSEAAPGSTGARPEPPPPASPAAAEERLPGAGLLINPIPDLPDDFMKGADVSMLAQIEASGGRFYDENGRQRDALRILRDHGMNWVRLRLWNQPVIAHDFQTDGLTIRAGESAGGKNDAARDTALARRARALGMKVLLVFHYSDWWADPGKQWPPQAWENMSLAELESAIYGFTHKVVADMKAAGARPDMVQIGNEVTNGMLWPLGRIGSGPAAYAGFAALLRQAARAVRDVDPRIRIMIHLDNGGNNELYRRVFSNLIREKVDFDVVGLSYYPYWHGTMSSLQQNLADVSRYFNKPVVVVETAYGWTHEEHDAERNIFGPSLEALGGYRATVQGQASFLRDLMAIVAQVPDRRGLGVFYWEPDWIAVPGAGWYTRGGDGWDNQTLFDAGGKALPSLDVFRAVSEERRFTAPTISFVPDQTFLVQAGTVPTLPSSVKVVYADDSVRSLFVVWEAVDPARWASPGSFEVAGSVAGSSLPATLHVVVYANLLTNPGFEEASHLSGWAVTDPFVSTDAQNSAADAHSGTYSFHWWNAAPFTYEVAQTVTGLEAGTRYAFSAWASGKAGSQLTLFANCGGAEVTAPITNTGWGGGGNWIRYTLGDLDGAAGTCTVGVRANAVGDDWGNLDDLELIPQ